MRARNIKPGFFKNEILGAANPLYSIVFQGLWCLADKAGRLEDRPLRIHAEINPYRDGASTVQALCWLHANHFIFRYTHGNEKYIQVLNFTKHQQPHIKEQASKIPAPEICELNQDDVQAPDLHGANTVLAPLIPDSLIPDSLILIPDSIKTKGAKKPKSPQLAVALIELPDFIDPDAWSGFIEMRKKIKKPPTERACQLLIKKLVMFHNAGHDANAILDQSTTNGWQDLFEIKESYRGNRSGLKTFEQQRVENIKNAMMGAMNDEAGLAGIQFLDG